MAAANLQFRYFSKLYFRNVCRTKKIAILDLDRGAFWVQYRGTTFSHFASRGQLMLIFRYVLRDYPNDQEMMKMQDMDGKRTVKNK